MTAIRGYVPPTTNRDAIGVHSLDHFVLAVQWHPEDLTEHALFDGFARAVA